MASLAQLPLNIKLFQETTFENFVAGKNQLLINALQQAPTELQWCNYLWGKIGSGKTHLLQASCHAWQQKNSTMMYIPLGEVKHYSVSILENLEHYALVALDDVDAVITDPVWAEALFHLYNRIHDSGNKLIISAPQAPKQLDCALADLQSRLSAATIFQLQPLNDAEKKTALCQQASQLGLVLNDEVGEFLLRRSSRDLNDLFESLATLDKASMVLKRKLTIPFIKEILQLD